LPYNPEVIFMAANPVSVLSIPYPYVAVKNGTGMVAFPNLMSGHPKQG
jgi:hypothetical protein